MPPRAFGAPLPQPASPGRSSRSASFPPASCPRPHPFPHPPASAAIATEALGAHVIGSSATAVTAVTGDIADLDDLDRVYEAVRDRGRGLDVLFADASIASLVPLEEVTEEHVGTLFTVQKALHLLNDGASVILNGSTNVGDEALGVYAATKAATRSFSRAWANEPKGRGIRVSTITRIRASFVVCCESCSFRAQFVRGQEIRAVG
ncbi:hypothetical protein C6Y14_14035 [Streptomyces dioscori]|uniref:Short-chain dehydrogenase n=1 Tax=Streptomyces dioscori TaxID=2109333 RepID=A0A2P8Q7Y1_9ACTN|nr:hypothetical protein C6Y14_14035 [Streptomyces dioscori]